MQDSTYRQTMPLPLYRLAQLLQCLFSIPAAAIRSISLKQLSDEDVAARAPGSPDAFAELYKRYLNRVYAYHFMRTGNAAEAQDFTSQTFLAALESIPAYRRQGCFAAWLLGIARRKAADYYRRAYIEDPVEFTENLPLVQTRVEDDVENRLRIQQLQLALKEIQPDRAEALILRIFSQLRCAEVAEIMQKTDGAVRTLVYRALQDLRRVLGESKEVI